jgi:putative hydrolase of the HAD superfamily
VAEEADFWRVFWDAFAGRFELSAAQTLALHEISGFYHTCFVAFPDALPCIEAIHAHGLRLAVLTNYELPSIHVTLQSAGLDPRFFSALLSSSMIGVSKPDPRPYYAAADALGVAPQECVFVDDLVENVEAACAVGMQGVLLDRQGKGATGAFTTVRDLEELTTLILEYAGVP